MRLPARLHVTWDDDNTIRMDIDAGTQTRRFFFENTPQLATAHPPAADASWQGYSLARWEFPAPDEEDRLLLLEVPAASAS